eukprot:XP_014068320.1 PREDICTED: pericentriolar material 1 protein-like [Salmo salar]
MTTLKSSKATTHISLMFKHSLSSSKNKRKQSREHCRTTDAGVTGGSLFEVLREAIYSEVANVISQNETRPCFIIVLFYQLQMLNTDYLRQRALFALKDRVARHLSERDVTEDQPVPASPVLQASPHHTTDIHRDHVLNVCCASDGTNSSLTEIQCAQVDTQQLDRQINAIMAEILPILKERVEEELSPGVHQTQGSGSDSREFIRFFHKQLSDVLQLRKLYEVVFVTCARYNM